MNKGVLRKTLLYTVTLLMMLTSTGCNISVPHIHQIEENAFIQVVGIDKGIEDPENMRLTIISEKSKVGGDAQSNEGKVPEIRSSEGKTLFEANRKLKKTYDKNVFWGHLKFVVIGEAAAKENILSFLDFLIRDHEARLNIKILVAKGSTAEEIINSGNASQDFVPDVIEGLNKNIRDLSLSKEVKLSDAIAMFEDKYRDTFMPIIKIKKNKRNDENDETPLEINGFAIFKEAHLLDYITDETARGLNWITSNVDSGVIVVKDPTGNPISLEIIDANSKIKSEFTNALPEVTLHIKVAANISEQQSREDIYSESALTEIEKKMLNEVKSEVESVLKYAQINEVDIFGIGDEIYHQHPLKWEKVKSDWKKIFPEMKININVQSKIARTYQIRQPIKSKSGEEK